MPFCTHTCSAFDSTLVVTLVTPRYAWYIALDIKLYRPLVRIFRIPLLCTLNQRCVSRPMANSATEHCARDIALVIAIRICDRVLKLSLIPRFQINAITLYSHILNQLYVVRLTSDFVHERKPCMCDLIFDK